MTAECSTLFDRYHASLAGALAQMGLHETLDAARTRDAKGLAGCAALPEAARTCLLAAPVAPTSWGTCGTEPPFTLFDGTTAREALLGAPVDPATSAARVAELAGVWHQAPITALDDAVTWTIEKTGTLAVVRTSKRGKQAEPVKQLTVARDRLFAIKQATTTQLAPFYRVGGALYLSWTSGAIAIPVTDETKFALDLAQAGRWIVWSGSRCTLVDPRRGSAPATCAWEESGGARSFVVNGEGVAQRWALRDGVLVHPKMDTFTKR